MSRMLSAIGLAVALVAASSTAIVAQIRRAEPVGGAQLSILRAPGSEVGVTARDLEPGEAERQKVSGGALIEAVRPESPAAAAGLQPKDVVVEFDGERVRSARQFARLVEETPPGREVRAAVMRDGRRTELQIVPAAPPRREALIDTERIHEQVERMMERLPETFDLGGVGSGRQLGVTVHDLTPQLAEHFGVKDGLLVASVAEGSPAARAGLRAGDVITSVGGQPLEDRADLVRAIRRAGGEVEIGIVRDRKPSAVKVTLPAPAEARPVRRLRTV